MYPGTVAPGPCPPKPRFHATWVLPYNLLRSQKSRPTPVPRAVLSDQGALPRWDANAVWDLRTTVHFYLAPTSTLIATRALPQIARHRILSASVLFNREKLLSVLLTTHPFTLLVRRSDLSARWNEKSLCKGGNRRRSFSRPRNRNDKKENQPIKTSQQPTDRLGKSLRGSLLTTPTRPGACPKRATSSPSDDKLRQW